MAELLQEQGQLVALGSADDERKCVSATLLVRIAPLCHSNFFFKLVSGRSTIR